MKILALDPATKCGFAHSDGISGVWDLSVKRDESNGMRLIRLKINLREIFNSNGIDLIAYEAVRHASVKNQATAMIVQSEIQGVIKVFGEEYGVEFVGIGSSMIKKHATGSGIANKDKMVEVAKSKFGIDILDDNHADALHILDYAKEIYL
jgi:Holliday junction resolvasome RuvABC endonuclease subunit